MSLVHMDPSAETLHRQSRLTAEDHLDWAIRAIDKRLGSGAAAKNPDLVCQFMRNAAYDYRTGLWAVVFDKFNEWISEAIAESKERS